MGFIGRMTVRIITSVAIVVILVSGIYDVSASLYEQVNAILIVFAIISADILIERYLSGEKEE